MAGRAAAGPRNWVAEACVRVGGVQQAAVLAGVREATMYGWRKQGYVHLLAPALQLAKASGIAIEKLAKPTAAAR